MRFGDILVTLDPSGAGRARMSLGVKLAARAHARLIGYYIGPTVGMHPDRPSAFPRPARFTQVDAAVPAGETAEEIRDEFESMLKGRGLAGDWVIGTKSADLPGILHYAHSVDLVVTGISPIASEMPELDVEALVVGSGRPVLALPPGKLPDAIGRNIVIAWDDSREASRAVHDALPFLQEARSVRLISLGSGHRNAGSTDLLVAHLDRLSIAARIDSDHTLHSDSPADEILSRLQIPEADLLVAGAFGHSRMSERLFGGASHTFLHQMMIPVLISH